MPLLRVESKGKPHILRLQLDGNTVTELKHYARFLGDASLDSVMKEALKHVFSTDHEFTEWKKNPENLQEPPKATRQRVNAKPPELSGAATSQAGAIAAKTR